jgi:hypothetical protein
MNKCTDVRIEDNALVMMFDDDNEITASAPLEDIRPKYPETFQAMLRKHAFIHWEEYMFDLGDEIYVDNIGLQDDGLVRYGIESVCKLTGCMWDYSDYWFFHPEKKNASGELQLVFLSHEDCKPVYHNLHVGPAFLYRWAQNLDIRVTFSKYEGEELK